MRLPRAEMGIAPIILAVVLAWTIVAVLLLVGTLSAADSIDHQVGSIRQGGSIASTTTHIDRNLDAVRLAGRTSRISARIRGAAEPLADELDQVVGAAGDIDRSVRSVLGTARAINRRAVSIDGHAHLIESTVDSIRSRSASIDAHASSIRGRTHAIDGTAGAIAANAGSINRRVRATDTAVGRIERRLANTLSNVRSIDAGVAGTNVRADRVIALAAAIERAVHAVLEEVGQPGVNRGHGTSGHKTVHGHANSIDCHLGPGGYCGR
jgi:hypothetical protein